MKECEGSMVIQLAVFFYCLTIKFCEIHLRDSNRFSCLFDHCGDFFFYSGKKLYHDKLFNRRTGLMRDQRTIVKNALFDPETL